MKKNAKKSEKLIERGQPSQETLAKMQKALTELSEEEMFFVRGAGGLYHGVLVM